MELLIGLTLQARLRERGPLTAAETLDVSQQLAAGLQAAHLVHVIHKDLKAENVILIESPGNGVRAVITDFGLASTLAAVDDGATAGPGFSGTPGYVAPERLAGAPVTEANDVYALGMVMLDMLTGTPPTTARKDAPVCPASPEAEPLLALSRRCRRPVRTSARRSMRSGSRSRACGVLMPGVASPVSRGGRRRWLSPPWRQASGWRLHRPNAHRSRRPRQRLPPARTPSPPCPRQRLS